MTTYTKEQFLADVKAEAVALRQHATKEELGRLSFDLLDSANFEHCVYGQMTGNCCSTRALELIWLCCTRFIKMPANKDLPIGSFTALRSCINGVRPENISTLEQFNTTRDKLWGEIQHFSSIEGYIYLPDSKNENLISYLRGETDDLNL